MKILPVSNYQTQNQNSKRQNLNFGAIDALANSKVMQFLEDNGAKVLSANDICPGCHKFPTLRITLKDLKEGLLHGYRRSELLDFLNSNAKRISSIDELKYKTTAGLEDYISNSWDNVVKA